MPIGDPTGELRHSSGRRTGPYRSGMDFLLRFGAVSGGLCGVLIGVPGGIEAVTGETAPTSFLLGLASAFGLPLLTALYASLGQPAGRFGPVAYMVNLIGLGLFGGAAFTKDEVLYFLEPSAVTALLNGPTAVALLLSALVFVTGSVLFGLLLVRSRRYPMLPAWGYATVLPLFALLSPLPQSPLKSGLHVLVGVVLVWLSAALLRRMTSTSPAAVSVGPAAGERQARRG